MKNEISFIAFLLASISVAAQMSFVHPGAVNSRADLDFVKAKIAANEQPWLSKFNQVKALATQGTNNTAPQDGNENAQKTDARKAYANALIWYFTDNVTYAQNAIDILNVWGKTFNGYAVPPLGQGNQSQLNAGWIGALMGPAAEIMRGYSGWAPADMAIVQNMFKTKFYPALNQMSTWNGNVDLTQIDAMMNIAVFCEDETEFNLGIQRLKSRTPLYFYLSSDDTPSNSENWYSPTKWVDGLTQETCRDNNHHAQYAMASAFHAAEVAWNQGVDIYGENETRYIAAIELMASQILSKQMGTCTNNITTTNLFNTWEVGYNHYHNRKQKNLPNTLQLLTKVRSSGISDWNIFFETLTHNINIATTGVVLTEEVEVKVFPNPSTSEFTIQSDEFTKATVYNNIGIAVEEFSFSGRHNFGDDYAPGVYHVVIIDSTHQIKNLKMVKEN